MLNKINILASLFTLFLLSFLIGNAATNFTSVLVTLYAMYLAFNENYKSVIVYEVKGNISLIILFLVLSSYYLIGSLFSLNIGDSSSRSITFIKTFVALYLVTIIYTKSNKIYFFKNKFRTL